MLADLAERRRYVETAVRRSWLVKLARPVQLAAGVLRRLDVLRRRAPDDPPEPAHFRRAIERGIAFSQSPPQTVALIFPTLFALITAALTLTGLAGRAWPLAIASGVATIALLGSGCLMAAVPTRGLYRQITRSVVVTARVKSVYAFGLTGSSSMVSLDYVFQGIPCTSTFTLRANLSVLLGETMEILVDRANPGAILLFDLYEAILPRWPHAPAEALPDTTGAEPAAMDVRLPEAAADAKTVDAYVSGTRAVKLVPLIERFVARLERRDLRRGGDAVLPDRAPRRASARKVLVFDAWPSGAIIFAAISAGSAALSMLGAIGELIAGDLRGLVHLAVALSVIGAAVVVAAFVIALRLRALNKVLARCVSVPGRVTSVKRAATLDTDNGTFSAQLCLTIEYTHEGEVRRAEMNFGEQEGALVGLAPRLLVDPQRPAQVFVRDFYV